MPNSGRKIKLEVDSLDPCGHYLKTSTQVIWCLIFFSDLCLMADCNSYGGVWLPALIIAYCFLSWNLPTKPPQRMKRLKAIKQHNSWVHNFTNKILELTSSLSNNMTVPLNCVAGVAWNAKKTSLSNRVHDPPKRHGRPLFFYRSKILQNPNVGFVFFKPCF